MSSDFKVPYTTILSVNKHPNADRLELATVYGFQVIVQKDRYKTGDKALYIPIDSILPDALENQLFPADSKIKLHNHRVRQIRIRGLASQGMLVDLNEIKGYYDFGLIGYNMKLETDLSNILGIKKYEPPEPKTFTGTISPKKKNDKNPLFHEYGGINNIKWLPNFFEDNEQVVIQEKLHGTNCRAGILPYNANSIWKRIKKWLGLTPKFERVYGSNHVDISLKGLKNGGYYGEDIYGRTLENERVFNKLQPGELVYGEIIGPNIQKNYDYGLKETTFVLFDVKIVDDNGKMRYLSPVGAEIFAEQRGFKFVPVIYVGPYNKEVKENISLIIKGSSHFDPKTKVKEGIVIKSALNYNDGNGGKRAVKWINEDYLDNKDNTDYH